MEEPPILPRRGRPRSQQALMPWALAPGGSALRKARQVYNSGYEQEKDRTDTERSENNPSR